jgi:hypothetical protein
MKRVTAGDGSDSTAAVAAWLAAQNELWIKTLYLIGDPDDSQALWLTDHDAPLVWSLWGKFFPANIRRGRVTTSLGLEVSDLDISWSPNLRSFQFENTKFASPYQLAQMGFYDNWPVRVWTVYMPTAGDADTFGCSELFGGRIAESKTERGEIRFTVNSFLDVVNQTVPTNVIELMNTLAGYKGATPPAGLSAVPQFTVVTGSTTKIVIGQCTSPNPGQIFANDLFQFGFLVFNGGGQATLAGAWSAVQSNYATLAEGAQQNAFVLFSPLPWAPTPGDDTFYVSAAFPINKDDGEYFGFPFVPSPESSL